MISYCIVPHTRGRERSRKPEDIINANTDFIDEIGLKEHLSPTRANGLVSMIKQMKMYAIAYNSQQENKA